MGSVRGAGSTPVDPYYLVSMHRDHTVENKRKTETIAFHKNKICIAVCQRVEYLWENIQNLETEVAWQMGGLMARVILPNTIAI